jgi:prepilin-type N-terminal cleavage/methylation domain-containing protein
MKRFVRGRSLGVVNHRRGLTLIELIVVLIILVGLGGLLVPVIGNALTRTHVATCSANFPEITQALMRMDALRGNFGNNWDSGMESGGGALNGIGYTTEALVAGEELALAAAGITQVFDHTASPSADYNVTFNPEYVPARALAVGQELITMTDDQARAVFLPVVNNEKYVVLGIGPNWTGLRDVAFEMPVHFGDTPGTLPHEVYSRFQGIFQVADAAGNPLPRAQFKGVTIALNGESYETADFHSAVYWTEVNGQ